MDTSGRAWGVTPAARKLAGFLLLLGAGLTAACDVPTGLPRIDSTLRFPVDSLVVPVAGVAASASESSDLSDIVLSDQVESALVRITPVNPSGATGVLTLEISGRGVTVTGSVNVAGPAGQQILMTREQVQTLLHGEITIRAYGTLCRASGCGFAAPPFSTVTLKNELELRLELGGEG